MILIHLHCFFILTLLIGTYIFIKLTLIENIWGLALLITQPIEVSPNNWFTLKCSHKQLLVTDVFLSCKINVPYIYSCILICIFLSFMKHCFKNSLLASHWMFEKTFKPLTLNISVIILKYDIIIQVTNIICFTLFFPYCSSSVKGTWCQHLAKFWMCPSYFPYWARVGLWNENF